MLILIEPTDTKDLNAGFSKGRAYSLYNGIAIFIENDSRVKLLYVPDDVMIDYKSTDPMVHFPTREFYDWSMVERAKTFLFEVPHE